MRPVVSLVWSDMGGYGLALTGTLVSDGWWRGDALRDGDRWRAGNAWRALARLRVGFRGPAVYDAVRARRKPGASARKVAARQVACGV